MSKKSCFVMMPFGSTFDYLYYEVYEKAISKAGFSSLRADEKRLTGSVMEHLWKDIQEAEVILADLSEVNGNVYYELGLAHALGKPAILVTEDRSHIPFDLKTLRIIRKDKDYPDWGSKLRNTIEGALREIQRHPEDAVPSMFRRAAPPPPVSGSELKMKTKLIEDQAKKLAEEKEKQIRELEIKATLSSMEEAKDACEKQLQKSQDEFKILEAKVKERDDEIKNLKAQLQKEKNQKNEEKRAKTTKDEIITQIQNLKRNGATKLDCYHFLRNRGYTNAEAFELLDSLEV